MKVEKLDDYFDTVRSLRCFAPLMCSRALRTAVA
jgi:hypothetical protein